MQAHEQLRAVLLTLLEEFPSDLPILLLATSSVPPAEVDVMTSSIFSERSVYVLIVKSTKSLISSSVLLYETCFWMLVIYLQFPDLVNY